jgi:hypothetical protein
MTQYVLDTDILQLFQEGHAAVVSKVAAVAPSRRAISVVTVEEQLSGWYTQLRKARRPDKLAWAYRRLAANVRFLSRLQIFDFDEPAIRRCEQLKLLKLKVAKWTCVSPRRLWNAERLLSRATSETSSKCLA